MPKYTPGDWEVDGWGDGVSVFDEREEATLRIVDHVYSWTGYEGEAEANARLIASAPDMYSFLQLASKGLLFDLGKDAMMRIASNLLKEIDVEEDEKC